MFIKNKPQREKVRVLIIDDHRMLRDGLKTALTLKSAGIDYHISEAGSWTEAVIHLGDHFDIAFVDVDLPGTRGFQVTRLLKEGQPTLRVLGISAFSEVTFVRQMLEAGACGFIMKNIEADELSRAVRIVLSGKYYFSSEAAEMLLVSGIRIPRCKREKEALTIREKEVVECILEGLTNEEIGNRLGISKRTVETHRGNIFEKLNIRSSAELIRRTYEGTISLKK